ncbi:GATA-type zinc finger protein 1 [Syngnathoides biaculeatus]|uniref:GATA-type zinc finger protein 1 n=1 Tax=Syngnathoides biaculeatus TaxID=300417 RepID=UPI002ADE0C01|nr:GATA-type zinc finger protein 1 [Syngnathoides biaculeatus]
MNTVQRSDVALFQRCPREAEKEGPKSALVYLFQEVSNLEVSLQSGDLDTRSLPCSLEDAQAGSPPSSSPPTLISPYERHDHVFSGEMEFLTECPPGAHSTWRSLSLINLQCERLMDLRDEESEPGLPFPNIWAVPSAHASRSFEGTDASVVAEEVLAYSQQFEADPELSVYVLSEGSRDSSSAEDRRAGASVSGSSWSHVHMLDASPNSQTGFDSNSLERSRPAHVFGRNEDLMLNHQGPSQPDEVSSKSHGAHVQVEETLRCSPATAASSQLRSNEGNETPALHHSPRTKILRKQPNPRRSADIRDPNFRGVRFRIGAELNDGGEECRLIVTSKYSEGLGKSVQKSGKRRKTRTSRTAWSSDEESKPTASRGKVCASCCTTKTPMWRDGEDGTPLCNACGIRYKKYRVRCVNCWNIPKKESNSNTCCLKCGNFVKPTSTQRNRSISEKTSTFTATRSCANT